MIEVQKRLEYITEFLTSTSTAWKHLENEIDLEIALRTAKLIGENNEQERGAIKALIKLKGLRDSLDFERNHITAALSEQDAAT